MGREAGEMIEVEVGRLWERKVERIRRGKSIGVKGKSGEDK